MNVQTSACPVCGAPIYAQSPWWGVTPPPPIYTCECVPRTKYEWTTDLGDTYTNKYSINITEAK